MDLNIGQKVAYPNQGICLIEDIANKQIGDTAMKFYALRVLNDNSTIYVPVNNAESVGIRPIINSKEYKKLVNDLDKDFGDVSSDWKVRSREYSEKLQSGDVLQAADVLKKLTYLSHEKKLSFREQTLLEKALFLIVSEVTNAGLADGRKFEEKINELIENACTKHHINQPKVMTAKGH